MKEEATVITIVLAGVFAIGFFIGFGFGDRTCRREAIRAGAAEYRTDREAGSPEFRWVVPAETQP